MNLHSIHTRSKSCIIKRKSCLHTVINSGVTNCSLTEPSTYKMAMKIPVWVTAMQDEIHALNSQGTLSLVPLPSHKNLVGCKWILKIKKNVDGSIARYKAKLVAQEFSYENGTALQRQTKFSEDFVGIVHEVANVLHNKG